MAEIEKISKILNENKEKNFVNRIINPNIFPVLPNSDGTVSTHSMMDAEIDGKHVVFPSVQQVSDGRLFRFNEEQALQRALELNEFIEFSSAKEASWFAKNYKQIWEQ